MGKWVHVLQSQNAETREGICAHCGPVKLWSHGDGYLKCANAKAARKKAYTQTPAGKIAIPLRDKMIRRPYRLHVSDKCAKCGFVPLHISQLDVDHIDGNHQNNDLSNLWTLCANCHRLKTNAPHLF